MLNDDYKEMLQCLSEENVRFLLVGAYAVAAYGYPRATKDIDILTRISGVDFQQAYERRNSVSLEGMEVPVISLEDLIVNKRSTGRTQDLADVERLESLRK
jgi:predicted nucleotidyltransferase